MEEIHRHVRQFVRNGPRNVQRQGQGWIKEGLDAQEHLRKTWIMQDKPLIVLLQSPSLPLPDTWSYPVQQYTQSYTRPCYWTTTLGTAYAWVPKSKPSGSVDWKGWPYSLATSFTRYHTPLALLLQTYVKVIVYQTKIRDITDLRQMITDAIDEDKH